MIESWKILISFDKFSENFQTIEICGGSKRHFHIKKHFHNCTRKYFPTSKALQTSKSARANMEQCGLRSHGNLIAAASKFPQIPARGGVKNVSTPGKVVFRIFLRRGFHRNLICNRFAWSSRNAFS